MNPVQAHIRSRRSMLLVIASLGATAVAPSGCESGGPKPSGRVRIATGSTIAVYHTYGSAIAALITQRLPDVKAEVLVTAASAENVRMVLNGRAELAFTQADIAGSSAGQAGTEPTRLNALARLYDDYVHLVVRDGSPIRTLGDLAGRRVSLGAPGSGTGVTAERLLFVARPGLLDTVQISRLSLDDSVAALRDGQVDAFFFSGGLPVAAIGALATSMPIRLVDLREAVHPLRRAYGEYYADRVVPASTYSGIAPTVTIGIPNYLVVASTMAEPMAYALTRLLFEGRETLARAHPAGARLNPRSAISTPPLPLHPGATRYYRDSKE